MLPLPKHSSSGTVVGIAPSVEHSDSAATKATSTQFTDACLEPVRFKLIYQRSSLKMYSNKLLQGLCEKPRVIMCIALPDSHSCAEHLAYQH